MRKFEAVKGAATAALFSLVISAAVAEPLYILEEFNSSLFRIDTQSLGTSELIGAISTGTDNIELVGASSSRLYTFDRDTESLITVSTFDASVISVVGLDRPLVNNPRGFDLGIDGVLYGVFDGLKLRSIDVLTGTTTLVADLTGANSVEAIAFASDGSLFASGARTGTIGNELFSINLNTGNLALIGTIGIEIDTLGFGANDVLYGGFSGPGRDNLYTINTASGALTNLGDTEINSIVGITRVLQSSVPLPGTLALLFIGLLGIGIRRSSTLYI